MPISPSSQWLRSILALPGARATGVWKVEHECLVQTGFQAVESMPGTVADGFANATRSVPLEMKDLGIVKAALTGSVVESRRDDGPTTSGSPYWLRQFEAVRSIAIPILSQGGRVVEIVSVATSDSHQPTEVWAGWLRDIRARSFAKDDPS